MCMAIKRIELCKCAIQMLCIRNHLHMQSHNVRRNVLDISSVIALLFVCVYVCVFVCLCVCVSHAWSRYHVNQNLEIWHGHSFSDYLKCTFSNFQIFIFLLSYAPFSIFPYIFSVILMQYCGKSENDRTIKSCIRIYIQEMKKIKKIFFPKIHFLKSYGPLIFRFFDSHNS